MEFRIVKLILALLITQSVSAQTSFGILKGNVQNSRNESVLGVNVFIDTLERGDATDINGFYSIRNIPQGKYRVTFSAIGFESQVKEVVITKGATTTLNITLTEVSFDASEVTVSAESKESEIRKSPIQTTVLEAKKVYKEAIGTQDYIRRTSGVHVRQQGGMGSNVAINLNGLTGNAVRIYYDGVPLEYFGGAIRLDNFPVGLIQRVEVYKGIIPIAIGSDALGGGVNLVPRTIQQNFLEASYEYGSFNTHRTTLAVRKKVHKNVVLGSNVFFNYSDNDYEMRNLATNITKVETNIFGRTDTILSEKTVNARRFHNRHISAYGDLQLILLNQKWADKFSYILASSYRFDEQQHGQRLTKTPAGEATTDLLSFISMIKYQKKLWKKFEFQYFGILTHTTNNTNDSTKNIYNWEGDVLLTQNQSGAELLGRPSLREGRNLGTSHRTLLTYEINKKHKVSVSNFLAYSRIDGEDPVGGRLRLGGELVDPNTIPSHFSRNISGIELKSDWFKSNRLQTIIFGKLYNYNAESIDILQRNATRLPVRNNSNYYNGYGGGLKYNFTSHLFIRSSFERALRIPTEEEIFGNFAVIIPNYELEAEQSDNINLGLVYANKLSKKLNAKFDINGFTRQQNNLIRLVSFGSGEQAKYLNEDKITSRGIEFSTGLDFNQKLTFEGNITYQRITIAESENIADESFIGINLPNIPDLFWNASLSYKLSPKFLKKDKITVFYNMLYVDPFSVTYVLDEANANPENIVPEQYQHNAGLTYFLNKASMSFTFQMNNILDSELYDNFRIPKPGRYVAVKIIYSKNNN